VYLRPAQAKGRRVGTEAEQWSSAGTIVIGDVARAALRAYIVELKRRRWCSWPPTADQPLFVAVRRNARAKKARKEQHGRLSVRTLQYQWQALQRQSGLPSPYHFHDLRHTAMTRCAEVVGFNLKLLASFGRCSPQTAMRYLQFSPAKLAAARNELAFR
jgi:integrase